MFGDKMNVDQITAAIQDIKDISDLRKINEFLRSQFDYVSNLAKRQFQVGDRVKFFAKKKHSWIVGTVEKKNPKYIVVKPDEGFVKWNVSPSSLESVE